MPLSTMSLRVHSICSWYSMGTFLWACWTGRMEGSILMVYVPDMLPIVLNELGKAHFKVMMSWATGVTGGVSVNLGLMGLRPDLGFVWGGQGLLAFRAGRGCLVLNRDGVLGIVFLMLLLMGFLNWTVYTVFFEPLWELPQGGEVYCGRDIRASKKVMHLAVFLKPTGLRELEMVMVCMCDCDARLGTFNFRIPRHSKVV